jgi:Icc protein
MDVDTQHLIQITDPHIGPRRDYRLAGVETLETLRQVLAEIGSFTAPPDLICVTGDIAAEGAAEAYRLFTQQIQFLELPYQWLPGNHDDARVIQEGFTAAPYWPLLELGTWRVISLNTAQPEQVGGHLADEELGFLAHCLAEDPQAPTLLFMHHPPIPFGCAWLDAQRIDNAERLEAILRQHTNVRGIFTGHVHQEFHTHWAGTELYTTPATCFQFRASSRDFALSDQPPGYRRINLHADGSLTTDVVFLAQGLTRVDKQLAGY